MAAGSGHDARVQREFARQAESFAASRTLSAAALSEALVGSLGAAGSGRVLDLAAGPGLVAGELAKCAREVVALDLTAETLRVARARLRDAGATNVVLVRGNGMRLPFPEGRFDGAVIRLALHHLEDPGAVLREAHRVLRPGARLGVLDLIAPEDASEEPLSTALERLRDPSHVRALGEAEIADALSAAGFAGVGCHVFRLERRFAEWAAIIADPVRMGALEVVMRELARRGASAGVDLRERDGELVFDYRFALVTGERA